MERRLSSERIYEGKILNLRVDTVEVSRSGRHSKREVVEHRDAVAILVRDGEGRFLFVRQFRYAIGEELLEIPAGLIDVGETPIEAAQRELREETGYSAARWTVMPAIWSSPGFSDEKLFMFCAEGLEWAPLSPDVNEDLSVVRMGPDEARALLKSTTAQDAKTMMALAWYFALKA